MARYLGWTLAVMLVCTPAASATTVGAIDCGQTGQEKPAAKPDGRDRRGPGGPDHRGSDRPWIKWWEEPKWKADIGITERQAADIKQIFDKTMVQLRADRAALDKLEAELSQTIKDDRSDIGMVTQQVDRVENLRAQMQKTRVVMLYRMHRVLSADQRKRLDAMFERLIAERRQNEPKRH
jgi:Spy/CpxP family protein refolding chaperone